MSGNGRYGGLQPGVPRRYLVEPKGSSYGVSNAGAILQNGTTEFPRSVNGAIQLYTMGARYGDDTSIAALIRLNQPVPEPEIQNQQLEARHEAQEEFALSVLRAAAIAHEPRRTTPLPIPAPAPVIAPRAQLPTLPSSPALGSAAISYWTGQEQQVTTITHQQGWNCQYGYAGQLFWRTFVGTCPASINVR